MGRKYRYRARGKSNAGPVVGAVVVAALMAAGGSKAAHGATLPAGTAGGGPVAARAVAYAKDQIGEPYLWGGTGPDAFDCSGLVYMAYGQRIARTSQEQWATETRVPASRVQAGDLVFFAGSDGTPSSPGHVGIVVNPRTDLMIDAYATGVPVAYATYGSAASLWGLGQVVGFTDPEDGA